MSYSGGEALLLAQVQACASFTSANTSRGNFAIVDKGAAKVYAILRPGAFEHANTGGGGAYTTNWTTVIEVWARLTDYPVSIENLVDGRQEIIERFDAWRRAGDTTGLILDVEVTAGDEPVEMANRRAAFIKQNLTVVWMERTSVTLQE